MRFLLPVALVMIVLGVSAPTPSVQAQPSRCPDTGLSDPSLLDVPLPRSGWTPAWEFTRGEGVTVAVIDTGVSAHPRLGEVTGGEDLVDGTGSLHDCDAHGTFVAGIIAARPGDDSVSGVAPEASILAIRQTSGDVGNLSTLASAVDGAVAAGARVINISTVSCSPPTARPHGSDEIEAAVSRAESAGVVVVSAAGNVSEECPEGYVSWPSVIPEVLAVTAVAPGSPDTSAEAWALTGPWVDVAAHGGPVVGLDPRGDAIVDSVYRGSAPAPVVGTSFAAPVVSGTAALVIARDPWSTPSDVRAAIITTASPVPTAAGVGVGVVDPVAAVTWPRATDSAVTEFAPVAAPREPGPPDPAPGRRLATAALACTGLGALVAAALLLAGAVRIGDKSTSRA